MRQITGGSNCLMGCKRKTPLYTQTEICKTCHSWLSKGRQMTKNERHLYTQNLAVRARRAAEVEKFPKGYRAIGGRPTSKGRPVTTIPIKQHQQVAAGKLQLRKVG